jgi:PadR family transcriptional regulator, regulatory protein PadR
VKLTQATAVVLQALGRGTRHGFDILDETDLPSGTVYPILRRLEREGFASGHWEEASIAQNEQRPPRRYYKLTAAGRALLVTALERHAVARPLLPRRRLRPARS